MNFVSSLQRMFLMGRLVFKLWVITSCNFISETAQVHSGSVVVSAYQPFPSMCSWDVANWCSLVIPFPGPIADLGRLVGGGEDCQTDGDRRQSSSSGPGVAEPPNECGPKLPIPEARSLSCLRSEKQVSRDAQPPSDGVWVKAEYPKYWMINEY